MPVPTSLLKRTTSVNSYMPHYSYHSTTLDRRSNISRYSSLTSPESYRSYGNSYSSRLTKSYSMSGTLRDSYSSDVTYCPCPISDYSKSVPSLTARRSIDTYSSYNYSNEKVGSLKDNILNRYGSSRYIGPSENDNVDVTLLRRRASSSISSTSYSTTSYSDKDGDTIRTSSRTPTDLPSPKKSSDYANSIDSGYTSETRTSSRPWRRRLSSLNNNYNTGSADSNSTTSSDGALGLQNIGNTCFMNSILQCMAHTRPLLEYCLQDRFFTDINTCQSSMKGILIKEFANLLQMMWKNTKDPSVNPRCFKNQVQTFAPRFTGTSQQDAQEFLRYLLQGLHEDINRVKSKSRFTSSEISDYLSEHQKATESWSRYLKVDDSKIVDLFVGQLKSTLKCCTCGNTSITFDPFWDLSIPIPKSYGSVSLAQCLDTFTNEEILDGDERPMCSKCKTKKRSTKSFSIHKFPRILVLHLKRFAPGESHRMKLSTKVDFPVTHLNLSPYATSTCSDRRASYNLYAVSNHSGSTNFGHYTAYCRHPYTSQWQIFNDSNVSRRMRVGDIVTPEAYILFYEISEPSSRL